MRGPCVVAAAAVPKFLRWGVSRDIQLEGNSSPCSRGAVGFRLPSLGFVATRTLLILIERVFCPGWTAPTP